LTIEFDDPCPFEQYGHVVGDLTRHVPLEIAIKGLSRIVHIAIGSDKHPPVATEECGYALQIVPVEHRSGLLLS
jgi:hypothetical protein